MKISAIYSLWLALKSDKVAITHLAMEIHFQTTDHVLAVEKVAEQHMATKYSICNSLKNEKVTFNLLLTQLLQ